MKLNETQWNEIRTRFEMGDVIREIARDFDIPHGTIQARAKREGWNKEIASKVADIQRNIREISQVAKIEQHGIIKEKLEQTITKELVIGNLDNLALNTHQIIAQKTQSAVKNNDVAALFVASQAAKTFRSQGLDVHKIAVRAGLVKSDVIINNNQNTQINNEFTTDPIAASKAYQDMINGAK